MTLKSALPLLIQRAIDNISDFVDSLERPGSIRAMRPERNDSLKKLLTAMLLSCSLQHEGAICKINDKWTKPKTIKELADQAKISFDQAKRCLAFLMELKFITSKQIKRKNKVNGQLEVSPGLRFFTEKFWRALGLCDLFKKSVEWAKKHCKRMFLMPFKGIIQKAKKDFAAAGEVMESVLKVMTPEQERTKFWCDKIRRRIRQIKQIK